MGNGNETDFTDADQRHVAIQGKALATAWTLEQVRCFTSEDILVVTDRKPLVSSFADKGLDTVSNKQIVKLKQRTLIWIFVYLTCMGFYTCSSRYQSPNNELSDCYAAKIALC